MATQILAIKKVFFPIEEAVLKAAEQNVSRDFRMGMPSVTSGIFSEQTEDTQRDYLHYARRVIEKTGENYLPEYPDTEHICVQGVVPEISLVTNVNKRNVKKKDR